MAPRMSEEEKRRSRSPHVGIETAESENKAGGDEEGIKGELNSQEEKAGKKQRTPEGAVEKKQRWTDDEWEEWRAQQNEKWQRYEDRWQSYTDQNLVQKQHFVEAQTHMGMQLHTIEEKAKHHDEQLADIREATAVLTQWGKDRQADEAKRQVKLLGWSTENRQQRKQVLERFLTNHGAWEGYHRIHTIARGPSKLLGFSLMDCNTREDRDAFVGLIDGNRLCGMFGEVIWARRNLPRYIREAGNLLRFLMTALDATRETKFTYKDWNTFGLQAEDKWVAAVLKLDSTGRNVAFCVDPNYYDAGAFERNAKDLWLTWGAYGKKSSSSSSSSLSSSSLVHSTDQRVYYVQDHHKWQVSTLDANLIASLDQAKAEKEEAAEQRILSKRGKSMKVEPDGFAEPEDNTDPPNANNTGSSGGVDNSSINMKRELQPFEVGLLDDDDDENSDIEDVVRNAQGRVVSAKYMPKPKKNPARYEMNKGDEDEEDDGITSHQAYRKARETMSNVKAGYWVGQEKSWAPMRNSSAEAVYNARRATNADGDYYDYQGEGYGKPKKGKSSKGKPNNMKGKGQPKGGQWWKNNNSWGSHGNQGKGSFWDSYVDDDLHGNSTHQGSNTDQWGTVRIDRAWTW